LKKGAKPMHILGYLIAVAVILAAFGVMGFWIYRRITGKNDTAACSSCNCHSTAARLSDSIETHISTVGNDQGDGHEDEPNN
jgi:hypothetical protein